MIYIKSIEIINSPDGKMIIDPKNKNQVTVYAGEHKRPTVVDKHVVEGRVFKNASGDDVCIAWNRSVQEELGLPFEKLDELRKKIEMLKRIHRLEMVELRTFLDLESTENTDLSNKLKIYHNLNWWQRILFLFGIHPVERQQQCA